MPGKGSVVSNNVSRQSSRRGSIIKLDKPLEFLHHAFEIKAVTKEEKAAAKAERRRRRHEVARAAAVAEVSSGGVGVGAGDVTGGGTASASSGTTDVPEGSMKKSGSFYGNIKRAVFKTQGSKSKLNVESSLASLPETGADSAAAQSEPGQTPHVEALAVEQEEPTGVGSLGSTAVASLFAPDEDSIVDSAEIQEEQNDASESGNESQDESPEEAAERAALLVAEEEAEKAAVQADEEALHAELARKIALAEAETGIDSVDLTLYLDPLPEPEPELGPARLFSVFAHHASSIFRADEPAAPVVRTSSTHEPTAAAEPGEKPTAEPSVDPILVSDADSEGEMDVDVDMEAQNVKPLVASVVTMAVMRRPSLLICIQEHSDSDDEHGEKKDQEEAQRQPQRQVQGDPKRGVSRRPSFLQKAPTHIDSDDEAGADNEREEEGVEEEEEANCESILNHVTETAAEDSDDEH